MQKLIENEKSLFFTYLQMLYLQAYEKLELRPPSSEIRFVLGRTGKKLGSATFQNVERGVPSIL